MNTKPLPILPPAMLGILGGGQLGAMFTVAAKTMGYGVTVLDPDANAPAARFADVHLCAPFDDQTALQQMAQCAAITTEFENVDAQSMCHLAQYTRVSPSGQCVAIAQNRIIEKQHIAQAGLPLAPYRAIRSLSDVDEGCLKLLPSIVKTAGNGYDGKGQSVVQNQADLQRILPTMLAEGDLVLEQMQDLRAEISVIVCRLSSGELNTFPPAQNEHQNGILAYSTVPATLPEKTLQTAKEMACRLAESLDYIGVLAVEMFVVGEENRLLINEIAPRPHNSGHYTLNACSVSQFEQQVRILCALPPAEIHLNSACCMANILGDVWQDSAQEPQWQAVLAHSASHLHLYGKKDARIGRKMGHFTTLAQSAESARAIAEQLHRQLSQS